MVEFVGLLAACLTTISFVPQAIHVIRTRQTSGLSLSMYLLFTTGIACWFAYGLFIGDLPIILANCVTLVLAGTILVIKARAVIHARRPRPDANILPSD